MLLFTPETIFCPSFVPVTKEFHFNKTGIDVHVRTDALHKLCDTRFGALILIRKEGWFWQNSLVLQKIVLTKLFKQPLKRLFNPFLLLFVQWQFRSAPKHIRSLSATVDLFNSRNNRCVSFCLNSAQALAASAAFKRKLNHAIIFPATPQIARVSAPAPCPQRTLGNAGGCR